MALCLLGGSSTSYADAMNALAFSGHNQTHSAQNENEHFFQARPSESQILRYGQQPALEQERVVSNPTRSQKKQSKSFSQKRLWSKANYNDTELDAYDNIKDTRSALEVFYSERVLEELEQFGYEFLRSQQDENKTNAAPPLGLVGDAYMLGVGDSLNIAFTGQRNAHYTLSIDANGQILIPGLAPLSAAGQSLGSFRELLKNQLSSEFNQSIYVALNEMRRASVLIAGHVRKPGRVSLTNQHTVIDALLEAGGIDKTGSLRQIRLIRAGTATMIDLYGLMMHGTDTVNLNLKDGDRLIVPPIGPTIAVTGDVKRPAIYEVLPVMQGMWHKAKSRSQTLALNDLLDMSGGLLSPGKIRYLKLDMQGDGDERATEIDDPFARVFSDGSILSVLRGKERRDGTVEIVGHARASGMHALSENKTLNALINSDRVLGKDIYPLIAVVERWNRRTLAPEYISFSPLMVLQNKYDHPLNDGDAIHFFSHAQIAQIDAEEKESFDKGKDKRPPPMKQIAYGSRDTLNYELEDISDDILNVLKERSLFIRGAVRRKGHYPISEGATLENVLAVSGGLTLEADKSNIEITRREDSIDHPQYAEVHKIKRRTINLNEQNAGNITINPGDTIRVNQKFQKISDNHVQIIGEVKNPGRYDLMDGDTVLSLVKRAGGLNKHAYPKGAIFSRKSERRIEAQQYKNSARQLEISLANKMQSDKQPNTEQVSMVQGLISRLENTETVGRITIEADPDVLAMKPELNMLLERGDRIYIPKRPLTVRVTGEVLSPSSLQFRSERKAREYIYQAGGYTRHADKDRVFVVYPDGSAQPLKLGNWSHSVPFIPPGSTIVVPHDPKPFSFLDSAKDITQIFTNLAVTGFLVSEIQDDD